MLPVARYIQNYAREFGNEQIIYCRLLSHYREDNEP